MDPALWHHLKAAFNARPLGMVVPPNWIGLAIFALLGTRNWGFWILGAGLELGYLYVFVQRARSPQAPLPTGSERSLPAISSAEAEQSVSSPADPPPGRPNLPETRVPLIGALTSAGPPGERQLRALAELLGMKDAASAPVAARPPGLALLAARLPYPAHLRGHPVALVAIDVPEARMAEPARVRTALQAALKEAGQRFELPFVILAGGGDIPQDLLPRDLGSLRLGEQELQALLYARDPERTFAGLLHARRLLGLSPYTAAGEVKDDQMFFGRVDLLKELLLAPSVQRVVVGPRRVGKTSLLKRLLRELPAQRPEVEPIFVDLSGISDHAHVLQALARRFGVVEPWNMDPATACADLLRRRFQAIPPPASGARTDPSRLSREAAPPRDGIARTGLIVVDEADGLVEADAARGFPLLNALRVLQAEEVCSFILAGYIYLYRETLNQSSPLHNFAKVSVLGPLEPEAARDLALVPMERLGVTYADADLPSRIAAGAGYYPSFVQMVCDSALHVLREIGSGDLILSADHITRAEARVAAELRDIFHANTCKEARLIAYLLVDHDDMSFAEAADALASAVGREWPNDAVEAALQELRLLGFATEAQGRIRWTIPLLRDALRDASPARAATRLADELRATV